MQNCPILKSFDKENLRRIALPLGGIGTGTVSLGGRGNLQDWAIMNTPAVGYTPKIHHGMRDLGPFFVLYTEKAGQKKTIVLEGILDSVVFEGSEGCKEANHGLPRFRKCMFDASYPMAQVHLEDDNIPLKVTLKAFNPLIPGDPDRSGIPGAILTYVLKNEGSEDVETSVCANMINIIGQDGREFYRHWRWDNKTHYLGNRGSRNVVRQDNGMTGIYMTASKVSKRTSSWGNMAISTDTTSDVTTRTAWAKKSWGGSILDFWDDFSKDGTLSKRKAGAPFNRMGSLAVKQTVPAGESREVKFYLTWYFPNRETWHPLSYKIFGKIKYLWHGRIGNYYCKQYSDSWETALYLNNNYEQLNEETIKFVKNFLESDLPDTVKEAALFNISTLRTQTTFRSKKGFFYGWEGIHDYAGSCMGSCTHVWNYEQTTAFLFGKLSRSMREVEFLYSTDKEGHMRFRTHLPMWINKLNKGVAAADGQMGTIMKIYREWQLSGDNDFLSKLWPNVKKAVEFCWLPGGWDGDHDGVMEGCQHNTMDVEYYGPNPQMQCWYLGALRAAEMMATHMKDKEFAGSCRKLFLNGSKFMDEELFNGEYYEHKIKVPKKIRKGLKAHMGSKDLKDPILQLGAGCLVDQLVGQYMAHICGLGYLLKEENVKTTLRSIMKYNFKEGFYDHFNHFRSCVLNDESALLMATYPHGNRPNQPFPYDTEVMTGFEHSTAAHMLYEGFNDQELYENGLKIIAAIRNRYDGKKRNPYDEAECGHHYARAMAAWAHVVFLTGFHYSKVTKKIEFHAKEGKHFWAAGDSWGTCSITKDGNTWNAELTCLYGNIFVKEFNLGNNIAWTGEEIQISADEMKQFTMESRSQ